jgi:GNAT superfamily N-acetyltransferase
VKTSGTPRRRETAFDEFYNIMGDSRGYPGWQTLWYVTLPQLREIRCSLVAQHRDVVVQPDERRRGDGVARIEEAEERAPADRQVRADRQPDQERPANSQNVRASRRRWPATTRIGA